MKKQIVVILLLALLTLGCTPGQAIETTTTAQAIEQSSGEPLATTEAISQTVSETTTKVDSKTVNDWQLDELVTTTIIEGVEDLPVILDRNPVDLFIFPQINADLQSAETFNDFVDSFIFETAQRHVESYENEYYICTQYGYEAYLNDDILSVILYSKDASGQFGPESDVYNAINIDLTNDQILTFEQLAERLGYNDNLIAKMETAYIDYMAKQEDDQVIKERRLAADLLWLWNVYYEEDINLPFLDIWFYGGVDIDNLAYPYMPDFFSIYDKKDFTGYLDGNGELHGLLFDTAFMHDMTAIAIMVDLNVSAASEAITEINPLYENVFGDSEGILAAAAFMTYLSDTNANNNINDFLASYDYQRSAFGVVDLTVDIPERFADEVYLFVPAMQKTATIVRALNDDGSYGDYSDYALNDFLLNCNMSDLHPDTVIEMRYRDKVVSFSPTTSLLSGEMEVPDQLMIFPEM